MAEPKCGDCKFWRKSDKSEWGYCHRKAPLPETKISSSTVRLRTRWASTEPNECCGEFQVRPSGEAGIEFIDPDDSNEPQI